MARIYMQCLKNNNAASFMRAFAACTSADLIALFLLCMVLAAPIAAASLLEEELTFERFDTDNNGQISLDEVKIVAGGRDGYIDAFRYVDQNSNLSIDEQEFELFLFKLQEFLAARNNSRHNPKNRFSK